jgi:hypothetical protein
MGEEAPETCWATHKRQVINLWNCCILLVDLFESNQRVVSSTEYSYEFYGSLIGTEELILYLIL